MGTGIDLKVLARNLITMACLWECVFPCFSRWGSSFYLCKKKSKVQILWIIVVICIWPTACGDFTKVMRTSRRVWNCILTGLARVIKPYKYNPPGAYLRLQNKRFCHNIYIYIYLYLYLYVYMYMYICTRICICICRCKCICICICICICNM